MTRDQSRGGHPKTNTHDHPVPLSISLPDGGRGCERCGRPVPAAKSGRVRARFCGQYCRQKHVLGNRDAWGNRQ